ncbi:sterol desaturase family protein [Spirosoma gilvum]
MKTLTTLLSIDLNYVIIGLLAFYYCLEQLLNTPFTFSNRPKHLLHNMLFQAVVFPISLLYAIVQVACITWLVDHQVGLLHWVYLPFWPKLLLGVALFDMTTYWFHRMGHVSPLLWRLHRVHHSDTTMDASSTYRQHPIEPFLVFGVGNIVATAVFGLDLTMFGLYNVLLVPFLISQHINLKTPDWVDKTFGLVFMTPNLHKVHHEQDQFYTDSNYADIFILWDRLFGSYKYKSLSTIRLGLSEFDEAEKQTFWYLMKSPFISIRRIETNHPSEAVPEES